MNRRTRRSLIVDAARAAVVTPFLPRVAAGSARQAAAPGNPLGDRWPQPDERYFYGRAADRREMQRTNASVTPGDVDGFVRAWSSLVDREQAQAAAAALARRPVTARDRLLRAANYQSQIQNLHLRLGRFDEWREAHALMRVLFDRAWQAGPAPFERVELPFEGGRLAGFFFPAPGPRATRRPAVLELNGIDHHKERIFFRSDWIPYADRGLHYLTIDGPGQGESLARGVHLRPDSEVAARVALDHLAGREDVDASRLGVFGTSFGGYFAPRAATDGRVRAMASRSSVFDPAEDAFDFSPALREHLRMLVGAPSLDEARRALARFSLRDVAPSIGCPVFVTHGSRDTVVSVASARKLEAALTAAGTRVQIVEGAGHNPGDESEIEQIDWLAQRLGA